MDVKLASKGKDCNHSHNILRTFDVLPIFRFTISETKPDR